MWALSMLPFISNIMRKKIISCLALLLLVGASVASGSHAQEEAVAIIVNRSNAVESVSFHELVQIFKQDKQFWSSSQKIYLLMMGNPQDGKGDSPKDKVLSKVYQMSDEELKKFWISRLYGGKITETPKVILTPDSMKRFVASISNAVGFINLSDVDQSVKVLKIDGKGPDDAGYPLK